MIVLPVDFNCLKSKTTHQACGQPCLSIQSCDLLWGIFVFQCFFISSLLTTCFRGVACNLWFEICSTLWLLHYLCIIATPNQIEHHQLGSEWKKRKKKKRKILKRRSVSGAFCESSTLGSGGAWGVSHLERYKVIVAYLIWIRRKRRKQEQQT